MVVNSDGWIVTAGHVLKNIMDTHNEVEKNSQPGAAQPKRRSTKRKGSTAGNPNDKTQCATLWSTMGGRVVEGHGNDTSDLAVGRLTGIAIPKDYEYPVFRRDGIRAGEFLCRVGYPFLPNLEVTWTQADGFDFKNPFPVPSFVNEALVSRFAAFPTGEQWIETSSPGLRGQSGGPLADRNGAICGIQVNTEHYPLDFEGKGQGQVLNVGRAVHVDTIRQFLEEHGISYLKRDS